MYSTRAQALLRSCRYSYVPRPAMARQRDRHHAHSRDLPTRGSGGPHHPVQGPPAGGQTPSPRPGPNKLRAGGLPPGTGHTLPGPMDPAPLAIHGDRALDLGHPHCPHTNRGRPRQAEGPRPQTTALPHREYHAVHRVLCRADLSPELAYPLPTTDPEVHQIRKLICEILAAAAEDSKLLLQTARPTTDHRSAPLRADTYTDTTTPPAKSPAQAPPPSLPTRGPTHAHHRTHPWAPRHGPLSPAQTATHASHLPDTPHHPPRSTTYTHPPRGAPRPTARPPRPVTRTCPPRTPQKIQAHPPGP